MKTRSLICDSANDVALMRAWLPVDIVETSHFFVPSRLSDTPSTAASILKSYPLQALLICNAYTTNRQLILRLEGRAEERLTLSAPPQRFEIELVSPSLPGMFFQSSILFNRTFGKEASDRLHLMGRYDPERAIGEAGMTLPEIIERLDDTSRAQLRATPIAQSVLDRIARLESKSTRHENSGDRAMHSRPPPSLHWE